MKQRSFLIVLRGIMLVLACALVLAGCGGFTTDGKYIPYDLQGTWECLEAASWWEPGIGWQSEKGKLVISYSYNSSVTISGPVNHLEGFTRNIALEAYTEDDGLLYIKDTGEWKSPVTYTLWPSADGKDMLITLKGGGIADETLKRIEY
jgi:hypothetical protein